MNDVQRLVDALTQGAKDVKFLAAAQSDEEKEVAVNRILDPLIEARDCLEGVSRRSAFMSREHSANLLAGTCLMLDIALRRILMHRRKEKQDEQ